MICSVDFVVRLYGRTLLNKSLADKAKDLFFKVKAKVKTDEFGLKANACNINGSRTARRLTPPEVLCNICNKLWY